MNLLLVTIAGGVGCLVRYGIEMAVRHWHPTRRPWGTVGANAVGCFIAALVVYGLASSLSPEWRTVLTSGFCGGLTTFSSAFAVPAILAKSTHVKYALVIVITTPLVCVVGFALGAAVSN
jgi:CrcB protein